MKPETQTEEPATVDNTAEINALKVRAYDLLSMSEQITLELRAINQRIQELT